MMTLEFGWAAVRSFGHCMVRVGLWMVAGVIVLALCLALFGSRLVIADGPQPGHVDGIVVLQGSIAAEKARIAGAVKLLQSGISDRILVSIPRESYWGQLIQPVARAFIEKNYGRDVAGKIDFCETGQEVDSTRQEAEIISACIQERHWNGIAIVTSEYHTRRASFLWRRTMRPTATNIWIEGVADPDFQRQWWRGRHSAKTLLMELSKLMWTLIAES